MNLADQIKSINNVDLGDLNLEELASWPPLLKIILLSALFVALLVAGFYLHIEDLNKRLKLVEREETTLRLDFEQKAFEAANLRPTRPSWPRWRCGLVRWWRNFRQKPRSRGF